MHPKFSLISFSLFLAPPDEKEVDGKIWIEFDDGDSGFFQLNEIKRIRPDFPVEGMFPIIIYLVLMSLTIAVQAAIMSNELMIELTLLNKDTKGTGRSLCVVKVSVLQRWSLNEILSLSDLMNCPLQGSVRISDVSIRRSSTVQAI